MKINYILLLKILILEIIYTIVLFWFLIFSLFGYFGSGAGASSPTAEKCELIANYLLVIPLLSFNLYKIFKLYKKQFANSMSYLIAEVFMICWAVYEVYTGFIYFD